MYTCNVLYIYGSYVVLMEHVLEKSFWRVPKPLRSVARSWSPEKPLCKSSRIQYIWYTFTVTNENTARSFHTVYAYSKFTVNYNFFHIYIYIYIYIRILSSSLHVLYICIISYIFSSDRSTIPMEGTVCGPSR
jgi:hypothetical protein